MKAMVLTALSKIEEQEIPQPVPADGEALVRVTGSGICGTDLKIFDGGMPARLPLVMGHEITGEIVKGHTANGAGPGTRVVIDPTCACGTCFHCKIGQTNLCPNSLLIGRERNGGFAEYMTIPETNAHSIPDDVDDDEAAFRVVFILAKDVAKPERLYGAFNRDVALALHGRIESTRPAAQ